MNANELLEKVKATVKKINKKTLIASGAVLIIGLAVLLNFLLIPTEGESKNPVIEPKIDLSDVAGAVNASEETGSASADAFAEMTLSRKQARDEAMDVLKAIADSSTAVEEVKKDAQSQIEQIAKNIASEANIESLIKAKGFEDCVAVINDGNASVIVKTDGLQQSQVAQISEIVYEEAGVLPTALKIIESKS